MVFKLLFCKKNKDDAILNKFKKSLSSLSIHNVFNPSFYIDENVEIFSFRAIKSGEDKISSFVIIKDKEKQIIKNISEEFSEKLDTDQLIDPKVTKLDNELYLTFNSGWNPRRNSLFVMKIYPVIEPPKKIIYNKRKEQERNWTFFFEDGDIYALYWVNPLKILKLKRRGEESWEFEDYYSGNEEQNIPSDLTIGTQLYKSKGGYNFVAHKKIKFLWKKIYFGKFCSFDFGNKKIKTGKKWLVYSLKSLLGSKIKHNTNLFSCTYFSGLQIFDGSVTLGYGVNDIEPDFSKYKIEDLLD